MVNQKVPPSLRFCQETAAEILFTLKNLISEKNCCRAQFRKNLPHSYISHGCNFIVVMYLPPNRFAPKALLYCEIATWCGFQQEWQLEWEGILTHGAGLSFTQRC